jgi:hypothetical protein
MTNQGKQGRDSFPTRTGGIECYGPYRLVNPAIVNVSTNKGK